MKEEELKMSARNMGRTSQQPSQTQLMSEALAKKHSGMARGTSENVFNQKYHGGQHASVESPMKGSHEQPFRMQTTKGAAQAPQIQLDDQFGSREFSPTKPPSQIQKIQHSIVNSSLTSSTNNIQSIKNQLLSVSQERVNRSQANLFAPKQYNPKTSLKDMFEDEKNQTSQRKSVPREMKETKTPQLLKTTSKAGPLQLISISNDLKTFQLNEEALQVIRQIPGDIGVVAVSGAQRTGKSFILNLLLDRANSGQSFKISPSVKSCTQGIWIWGEPVWVEGRNMHIVLLDTEGSGSLQKNQTHDAKIFALVVLLSSLFIFNSMQTIDENAISCLSLAAELSNFIKLRSSATDVPQHQQSELMTPKFLWLLRDFALELHENGRDITENEYLENRLTNFSRSTNQRNKKVRDALVKYFQQRELLTMVRPVEDEEFLGKLDKLPWDQLRPEFRRKADILRHKVFNETPAKLFQGRALTGPLLANLITQYVGSLNKGATPNISSAWDAVLDQETQRQLDLSLTYIDTCFTQLELPLSTPDFLLAVDHVKTKAITNFDHQLIRLAESDLELRDLEIKRKQITLHVEEKIREYKSKNLKLVAKDYEKIESLASSQVVMEPVTKDQVLAHLRQEFSTYLKGHEQVKELDLVNQKTLCTNLVQLVKQVSTLVVTPSLNPRSQRDEALRRQAEKETLLDQLGELRSQAKLIDAKDKAQNERVSRMKDQVEQEQRVNQAKQDRLKELQADMRAIQAVQLDQIDLQMKSPRSLKTMKSKLSSKQDSESGAARAEPNRSRSKTAIRSDKQLQQMRSLSKRDLSPNTQRGEDQWKESEFQITENDEITSPKALMRLKHKTVIQSDDFLDQEEFKYGNSIKVKRLTSNNREDLNPIQDPPPKLALSKPEKQGLPPKAKMFQKASMFI